MRKMPFYGLFLMRKKFYALGCVIHYLKSIKKFIENSILRIPYKKKMSDTHA